MPSRLVVFFIFLSLAGCVGAEPLLLRDPAVNVVWPPPPTPPRIGFLREIKGPDDIVSPKGRMGKLLELVAGDDHPRIGMHTPYGIVFDGDSVIYIADSSAGLIHRYDLRYREVSYISQAGDELLASPVGVALDADGNLYVSDSLNAKVYKLDKNGGLIRELKPPGGFKRPAGIAVNILGEKYVVDVVANTLFTFDKDDLFVSRFPKIREGDELSLPSNVTVDRQLNVYVTDSMNFMVRVYDHDGNLLRNLGSIGDAPGTFARPKGVAVDSNNNVYVVDAGNDNFQVFNQEGRLLLFVGKNGLGPGDFYLPSGICIDSKDRIFIADTYNRRVQVFQYLREGVTK